MPPGADGNVEVSMSDVVEAEVGKTAIIRCGFSIPVNSTYAYVNWFYMDSHVRKKIIYMVPGMESPEELELKGRVRMGEDFALTVSKVTPQDAKVYVCQVGAGSAGVGENRTELRVSKAPETPEVKVADSAASLSVMNEIAVCVSRNGYPTPAITWYKDENLLESDGEEINIRFTITKESSGLFTVSSSLSAQVTKEDRKAIFHCQVNYSLMGANKTSRSNAFNISVNYPSVNISFVISEPNREIKEGDKVTLLCEGDGNPPPEYTFFRVKNGTEEKLQSTDTGKLVLENVMRKDSGLYQCQAFDLQSMDELKADVKLSVNYLEIPTITKDPPRHLKEGDNLLLTCGSSSSKPLEFQWKKEGKVIVRERVLNITDVTHEASGSYSCIVSVPEIPGLSHRKQVSVNVHSKPRLFPVEEVVFVHEGKLLSLTCAAVSNPRPSILWTTSVNSTLMPNSTIITTDVSNEQRNSTFSVFVTKEILESEIRCSARNNQGEASHRFKMRPRIEEQTTAGSPTSTKQGSESQGVIIVPIVICILAIALLGAVLYFLHKKGKLPCGRSGKQEITKPEAHKDEIVVEVKSDKLPEEAGLLQGADSEKRSAGDQGEKYIDLRN
ncbi:cell surface glycoprotein MUC18 isoform X2 [Hemicordylus capensis]|uniref:cell surface glycoprotein MUC18 isoform X2 n=1 Tax=Hemicordylus capensis TaxID=884348 RepID=UPI002303B0A6|nr:cell surface glycoprotein MUC18 isoform X2 [Hemicordylus capensis]